jgi:Papain-like cysteine protease AvrRpt2
MRRPSASVFGNLETGAGRDCGIIGLMRIEGLIMNGFANLPRFFAPVARISAAMDARLMLNAAVAAGGATGIGPGQKVLSTVTMSAQEQTNWCWSSVTQSVKAWAGSVATQTDVATAHVTHNGRTQTCAPPNGSSFNNKDCGAGNACAASCNDPHILSVVLTENGLFNRYISQNASPAFGDLVTCINSDKPVPCRIQWQPSGGHFILVVGWTVDDQGKQSVHVLDPASASASDAVAERVLEFQQFINSYSLSGVVGTVNYSYEV